MYKMAISQNRVSCAIAYIFFFFQDFINLDMGRYQYGGVNITGFQLVNYSSPFVKNFLRVWRKLDPGIWPGAAYNSIHVTRFFHSI